MIKIIAAAATISLVAACNPMETKAPVSLSGEQVQKVKSAVTGIARNARSVEFRGLRGVYVKRMNGSELVACGEVNGQNGFGGFTGFNPFYYNLTTGELLRANRDIGGLNNAATLGAIGAYCD